MSHASPAAARTVDPLTSDFKQSQPKLEIAVEDRRHDLDPSQPTPKRLRVVVDDQTLRFLFERYRVHYADFSKSKNKVTQLIPNKVWTKIWDDYIKSVNGDLQYEEKTLKLRLRAYLMNETKDAHGDDDQSTTSEGRPSEIDDKPTKLYLQTMTQSLVEICKSVKKLGTEAEKYYKEEAKYAQIRNLQILAQMKVISEEELHSRTKTILLSE